MKSDEFEFQDKHGNEIEPTKNQLVIYIKSLHKQITEFQKQLEEKEKEIRQLDNEKGMLLNNSMKLLKEKDDELKSQPAEFCQKLIDMLTDRAELIEVGLCAEFMFTVYDLLESVKELLEDY